MTGTRTPPRPAPSIRQPVILGVVVLAVLALAFGIGVGSLTEESGFVDQVTVDNPTPYNLQVDVGGAVGGPALALGTTPREGSRTFEQVVDQGGRWVFRLSFGADRVGEIVVPRAQLERDGWKVTVPADVGRELAETGRTPSAF